MSKSPADDVVSIYREHADAFVRQRGTGLIERPRRDESLEHGRPITGVDASLPLLNRAKAAFFEHARIAADMQQMAVAGPLEGKSLS